MNEGLRKKYEDMSKMIAYKTVTSFIGTSQMDEAKNFAKKTIDDWIREGKTDIIEDFKKWLKEQGLSAED